MSKNKKHDRWLLPAVLAGLTLTNTFMLAAVGALLGLLLVSCDNRPRPRMIGAGSLAMALVFGWTALTPLTLLFALTSSLAGLLILRNNLFSTVTSGALVASLLGILAVLALLAAGPLNPGSWVSLEQETLALQQQWGELAGQDAESRRNIQRTAEMLVLLLPGQYVLMMLVSFFISVLVFRRWGRSDYPLSLGCPTFSQYRFEDHWIWLLIVGLALALLADEGPLHRLALNLLFVMGVLYVIRGLAVMFHFIAVKKGGIFFRVLALALCLTPVCLMHLAFGVFDTWVDFRKSVPAEN